MVEIARVGDFSLVWGESVRWDDRRQRLYFVDCATHALHWLDDAEPPLRSLSMPSMPTGLVLTTDDRLVVLLDDGLHSSTPRQARPSFYRRIPRGWEAGPTTPTPTWTATW